MSSKRKLLLDTPRDAKQVRIETEPTIGQHSLPTELISLIFAYFSTHARLAAVSLVCKRWRTAALRSITSLRRANAVSMQAPAYDETLVALCPSLTALSVPHFGSYFAHLPSNFQVLERSIYGWGKNYQALAEQSPSLTSISAVVRESGSAFLNELMLACADNLRELHLSFDGRNAPGSSWLSLYLPHLERLSISCNAEIAQAYSDFSVRHFSQLTELDVKGEAEEWLKSAPLPRLTSLTVYSISVVLKTLPITSRLELLRVRDFSIATLTPTTFTFAERDIWHNVQLHSRDLDFALAEWNPAMSAAMHGMKFQVMSRAGMSFLCAQFAVHSWPNLASLTMHSSADDEGENYSLHSALALSTLPSLTHLSWCMSSTTRFGHVIATIQQVMRSAPRLKDLEFRLPRLGSYLEHDLLEEIICTAEQRGLHTMNILYGSPNYMQEREDGERRSLANSWVRRVLELKWSLHWMMLTIGSANDSIW